MADPVEVRIEKLIKLSQGTNNPNEAKSAMAMAEHLARKHGVKIADIKESPKPPDAASQIQHVANMMKMFGLKAGRTEK